MAAFQSHRPMKTTLQISLLFATVALIGDMTLRQLPNKVLADLAHVSPRVHAARATKPTAPFARSMALAAALTRDKIAATGRIVTFSTQNLRDRLAIIATN